MRCPRLLLAALAHALFSAAAAHAQTPTGSITGRVVDSTSQQPIANVSVVIDGTGRGAVTRSDGGFLLRAIRPARTGFGRAHRIRRADARSQW
jgi:iron complex outermembrane receptor protein